MLAPWALWRQALRFAVSEPLRGPCFQVAWLAVDVRSWAVGVFLYAVLSELVFSEGPEQFYNKSFERIKNNNEVGAVGPLLHCLPCWWEAVVGRLLDTWA
jgi:hypothetical protein